jgi:hypothetical protein
VNAIYRGFPAIELFTEVAGRLGCDSAARIPFLRATGFSFAPSHSGMRPGKVVRWYGTGTDIEDRKQAEEELRGTERDLHEAQKLSHTDSWKYDLLTGAIVFRDQRRSQQLLGLTPP